MRLIVIAALFTLMATGCRFGQVGLDHKSGDLSFDPTGTLFAYVDGHDDNLAEIDRPRVALLFTWLVFDPRRDLNDLSGQELEEWRHEFRMRDAMAIAFADQADVKLGKTFESIVESGTDAGDEGFSATIHLTPERLSPTSTYQDFKPVASRRTVKVSIDDAGFEPGVANVEGRLEVRFDRTDDDPADAVEGAFEGTFVAPVVEERLAEHNLSLLTIEDVVGLPLPPAEDDQ